MLKTATTRSEAHNTKLLARAIAGAMANRGYATVRDGTQAGLSEAEVSKLWDGALIEARRIEPRLLDMAAQP